jgi:hypothetical protein
MRLIALIANLVVLVFLFFEIVVAEIARDPLLAEGWGVFALLMGCPILNIIALGKPDGWFGMYLKRRTLEEKKKIEALEKQRGEE